MDGAAQQIESRLAPLLRALATLELIARHLHPPDLANLLSAVGAPDDELRRSRTAHAHWPAPFAALGHQLDAASDAALATFDGLRGADDFGDVFIAMRNVAKALNALYPLAGILPAVNRFFLDPAMRSDEDLQARFMQPPHPGTGVMHLGGAPDAPGTVWVYVPESYSPDVAHPLVMALHGGSGLGRNFIWTWVRAARSRGAILVAPTSMRTTWAIQEDDRDTPHIASIVSEIQAEWHVDRTRMLLTGMSDGGTFTYTSGLETGSPFTHLAPVAAAFHPMLVMTADRDRLTRLPVHIIHGALDWMFPVAMAHEARDFLSRAGANVTYREIPDLSHAYSADLSTMIADWLLA